MTTNNRLSKEKIISRDDIRLHPVVEKSPDAFITINSKGTIISWNWAAEKYFGYSRKEMIGKNITAIMPERFKLQHRRGMNYFFKTGKGKFMGKSIIVAGKRADGSEFPIELTLSAWNRGGETFVTGIIRDITERLEAEESSRYRLEQEQILSAAAVRFISEDPDDAVRATLADTGHAVNANRTFLILYDDDQNIVSPSAEWRDAAITPAGGNLRDKKFNDLKRLNEKIFNNETVIIDDAAGLPDDAALEKAVLAQIQLESMAAIPVRLGDKIRGFIGFGNIDVQEARNSDDIIFIKKISEIVGLALQKRQEIKESRPGERLTPSAENKRFVGDILYSLFYLPEKIDDIDFSHIYRIASADINQASGDFFDLFEIEPDKLAILIGDVSGRGLAAINTASKILNTVKAYAFQFKTVSKVISGANDLLLKTAAANELVTLFFGVLNKKNGSLHFCNAGHPTAIVRRSEGVNLLHARSPAIGIYGFLGYIEEETTLKRGDLLILYTKGLTQLRLNGQTFDMNRLVNIINKTSAPSAADLKKEIEKEAVNFSEFPLKKDYAVLIVSRKKKEAGEEYYEMENIFNLITSARTVTETFRYLTEGLNKLLHTNGTCVFNVDRKEGKLKGLLGMPVDVWPHIERVTIDLEDETSGAALAARSKKVVTIDQVKQDAVGKQWLMDFYKPKSLLFLPIIAENEIIGVAVAMDTDSYRTFTENEVNSALMLISRAALVISEKSR